MFRIAIIGGGLGGLFTALSIHHHCRPQDIQVDVYEQASQYGEVGAGVGIGANAAGLIEKLGLMDEALKITGERPGNVWLSFRRYDNAEEIHTILTDEKGLHLSLHRAEFLEILVRAVQERGAATLHTNKRCQALDDQDDTMLVTFADGTTTTADLVIGADGIHSVARSKYISDEPQYGGMVVYRALCDVDKIADKWTLPTYGNIFMAPGKHFLVFPISRNKTLSVVAFVSTPRENLGDVIESYTLKGNKDAVKNEFKDFAPEVQAVIQNMEQKPLKWILFDRPSTARWNFSGGKVVLLGDAAHAMCPHQGAGAGQALEDGYIIGRVLGDYFNAQLNAPHSSLEDWLNLYQSIRYPRSEKVQQTSREAGDLYEMKVKEISGLSFEEALPQVKAMLKDRMKWIWGEDLDKAYEDARAKL